MKGFSSFEEFKAERKEITPEEAFNTVNAIIKRSSDRDEAKAALLSYPDFRIWKVLGQVLGVSEDKSKASYLTIVILNKLQ